MAKPKISVQEYQEVEERARAAEELMTDPKWQFVRDYFQKVVDYAEETILNNTVRSMTEELTITDKIKRYFHTPKQVQIDQLSGQYQLVKKFFTDMKAESQVKKDLDTEIAQKRILYEVPKKDISGQV